MCNTYASTTFFELYSVDTYRRYLFQDSIIYIFAIEVNYTLSHTIATGHLYSLVKKKPIKAVVSPVSQKRERREEEKSTHWPLLTCTMTMTTQLGNLASRYLVRVSCCPAPASGVHLKLHCLRRLRAVRFRQRGFSGERRPPARGARLPRGEPAVDAPHVEAVVAARQRAHAVTLHELREADGAFRRAAPGELDLAGVEYPRGQPGPRPALPPGGTGLAGGGGRIGGWFVLVLAVAHAARDAECAAYDGVDHEHGHQAAQEQRERRDHRRVQRAEGRCGCVRVRYRHRLRLRHGHGRLRLRSRRRRSSRGSGGVR
jgi:hypothetical protein